MDEFELLNLQIAKAIIINQLCLEANEDLKNLPIYRQNLKFHLNKVIEELEDRVDEFNDSYEIVEDFIRYSSKKIEELIPMIVNLRLDELVYLSHFIELYNKDHQEAVEMLAKGLKTEIR